MNTKSFITIVLVALFVFVFIVSAVAFATAEDFDLYPKASVLVDFNTEDAVIHSEDGEHFKVVAPGSGLLVVKDEEGNTWEIGWEFEKNEEFSLGEVVAMLMWEVGTPDFIFDDQVQDAVLTKIMAR